MTPEGIGKLLMGAGVILVLVGGGFLLAGRLGFKGMPGDIHVERGSFSFSFPIVTCLVVSVVATILLNFFRSR